jgi:branched-chain amino acid transport system permease protein
MKRQLAIVLAAAGVVCAALVPFVGSVGLLSLLAVCFVFGALALSYDLLFGYTGLLSFGHALYFATGVYATAIALSQWHWPLLGAVLFALAASVIVALVAGAVSLRTHDIAFAMVTLAFAQAGSIVVLQNPAGLTGGEEGLPLSSDVLPAFFAGVANTKNLYWLALGLLLVTWAFARWLIGTRMGRIWQAIRENERRVATVGIDPYRYRLAAFIVSSTMAALCGVVYVFIEGGATPDVTTSSFTLALLVMVVLGGVGTLWGAVLGGMLYEFLDFRLVVLSGATGLQSLPPLLRIPLSQPLFILGLLFVLLVLFVPGGLAGAVRRLSTSSKQQSLGGNHP